MASSLLAISLSFRSTTDSSDTSDTRSVHLNNQTKHLKLDQEKCLFIEKIILGFHELDQNIYYLSSILKSQFESLLIGTLSRCILANFRAIARLHFFSQT